VAITRTSPAVTEAIRPDARSACMDAVSGVAVMIAMAARAQRDDKQAGTKRITVGVLLLGLVLAGVVFAGAILLWVLFLGQLATV
jgi:hypothetical protein